MHIRWLKWEQEFGCPSGGGGGGGGRRKKLRSGPSDKIRKRKGGGGSWQRIIGRVWALGRIRIDQRRQIILLDERASNAFSC
jgi:hypothetical protein